MNPWGIILDMLGWITLAFLSLIVLLVLWVIFENIHRVFSKTHTITRVKRRRKTRE